MVEGLEPAASIRYSDVPKDRNGSLLLQVSKLYLLAGLRFRKVTRIVDIDEKNLTYARSNVIQNNLKSRVRPYQTKLDDPLIPLNTIGLERHVS